MRILAFLPPFSSVVVRGQRVADLACRFFFEYCPAGGQFWQRPLPILLQVDARVTGEPAAVVQKFTQVLQQIVAERRIEENDIEWT